MSAPSSSGRWWYGVMNVLSTASRMFAALHTSATPAMSTSFSIGLVGVSIHTSFVVGRTAALTAAAPPSGSTYVNSKPSRRNTLSNRRNVPPYRSSHAITCVPVSNICSSVAVAARPEAKHRPPMPFSSDARFASSANRVRLCVREYSKPLCTPGADCAYVDV